MGDAFGASLQRTPRTGLADAISNLMYQSIFGGAANSGDPRFDAFIRAFANRGAGGSQQVGGTDPILQLLPLFANFSNPDDPENWDGIEPPPPGGPEVPVPNQDPTQWPIDPNTGQPAPPPVENVPGQTPTGGAPPTNAGPGQFRLGDFIQQMFSLPQYGGQMGAGLRPEQLAALGQAGGAAGQFFGSQGGTAQQIISQLLGQGQTGGGFAPAGLENLLSNLPGQDILRQIGMGGGPGGGALQGIASGQGNLPEYDQLFNAISSAQQGTFNRNLRDIREQYSSAGLRQGSDLANAFAQAGTENAQNIGSMLAQLGLQSAGAQSGARLGAAQELGRLGLGAGQALGQAGLGGGDILSQLFSGQQGRALSALQALPGAQATLAGLPMDIATRLFGLGEAARGVQDTNLQRMLAEFQRTQGALFPGIVNYASGAPIISSPGIGSQVLGAGASLGGAALGAK